MSIGDYNRKYFETKGLKKQNPSEYYTWWNMRRRCIEKKNSRYSSYGGRGITTCKRWLNSFENFFNDMGKKPFRRASLDRIDNDRGYTPSNCRWTSQNIQANNTRANHFLEVDGVKKTLSEWEKHSGIKQNTIWYRLHHGWDKKEAITRPVGLGKRK